KNNFKNGVLFIRNLKRHKAITLRMTPEEFTFFTNQMKTAKQKTQTDFFLAVLRKKPIIVIEDLRPMLQELKRHGNNLNQVARQLNETVVFGESAKKVMNECWKCYRTISQLEGIVLNAVIRGSIRRGGT
ncbi:MAG: MobC family plasmid mobilization relaxosome protein, partial [Defluviitaleaceae bacterium]|nr:MobC family plasmid mobilization relaxosome protein [Defluviitaleaceae bacterium]